MIIIHIHHTFHPVLGGLERVVYSISKELVKLGHEVHVVTSIYGASNRPRYEEIDGIHVHRLRARTLAYLDLCIPREFPRDIIKRADVVHVHSHNSLFNLMIASVAKGYGVSIVVHFMAIDALLTHPNTVKRLLGFGYQRLATLRAIRLADVRLVKSFRDMYMLKLRYGVDAYYVPDGIDKVYFRIPVNPHLFLKKFKLENTEYLFLYIGRLHPAKGPHILVKAIPYLFKYGLRDFCIAIVGPGNTSWLKKLAKRLGVEKHVTITGPIPERLKISAIDASTCLVVPSLYDYVEVFSLTTSEAWARGKPVIASKVGELAFRVKHGVNGLLVEPGNPQALAKALQTIVETPLKPRGGNLLTWCQVAKELEKVYIVAKHI